MVISRTCFIHACRLPVYKLKRFPGHGEVTTRSRGSFNVMFGLSRPRDSLLLFKDCFTLLVAVGRSVATVWLSYPNTDQGTLHMWSMPYNHWCHYNDVIMGAMASQITSLTIVYSTVYSDADKRKHQSSASLAFVRGIHRWPVNSLHKWPVTRKMFPIDDVIMFSSNTHRFTRSQCFHVVFLSCWNPWFRNCYHCNMANAIKTHLPLVPHICVSELGQHCFRQWLGYYLNQF